MVVEHLRRIVRIISVGKIVVLTLLSIAAAAASARADFVLLKEDWSGAGAKFHEGTVEEKGGEYEVTTRTGTFWVEKSNVIRIVKSLEELTAEADKLYAVSTKAYEEAKKQSDPKQTNAVLKKAIEDLEKARDMFFDARKILEGPQYRNIDKSIRDTIQLIKMCRDSRVQEGNAPAPTPVPAPTPAPKPADPIVKQPPENPPSSTPAPRPQPGPAQPVPLPPSPLIDDIRKLLDEKKAEAAWKKFEEARKIGEETEEVEPALVKVVFEYGRDLLQDEKKKQGKKGIEYIRKAHRLQPDNVEHKALLAEALLMLAMLENTGTNKSIAMLTEVIDMTDDLIEKDAKKADYVFWKAQAYHGRGFFSATKFSWKAKHGQIKNDFNTATDLYNKVLGMSPGAGIAHEAKNALKTLDLFLEALRTGKTPRKR